MIRVVLDTNIIVSALLRSGGLPDAVLRLALSDAALLCVSSPIIKEYENVLRRARFSFSVEKVSAALTNVRQCARIVTPTRRVTAALDADDNIFLECAEAAAAHYLVTGNIRHFPAMWVETQVVTPRQFLEAYLDGRFRVRVRLDLNRRRNPAALEISHRRPKNPYLTEMAESTPNPKKRRSRTSASFPNAETSLSSCAAND
jgi:putative PIN family toxin of toxin-antitoxin system